MWRSVQASMWLGGFLLLGVVGAVVQGNDDTVPEEDYPINLSDIFENDPDEMTRQRRDPRISSMTATTDGKWPLGLGKSDGGDRFKPYVSVGVLSNMQQFFDNLKTNVEGLDSMPEEEREALLGKALVMAASSYWTPLRSPTTQRGICGGKPCWQIFSRYSRFPHVYQLTTAQDVNYHLNKEQDRTFRPRATAAYLHALRNHRPSHKLRNFVEDSQGGGNLRGANNYDPNLLWSGLGKRR